MSSMRDYARSGMSDIVLVLQARVEALYEDGLVAETLTRGV